VTEPIAKQKELPPPSPERPGRVQKLMGIIFQSDQKSVLGSWIIRPVEMLDRWLAGLGRSPDNPSLAMHVGIHVLIDDGREFVVEQLVGTAFEDFVDGLNWTPLETFRARDRGGWDVTIPATAFRGIDNDIVEGPIDFLNMISVRPFFDEDCTKMVERAFGKRRMFADSPAARTVGFGLRVGDPTLALLRPDFRLDDRSEPSQGGFLRAGRHWVTIYTTLSRAAFATSSNVAHPASAMVRSNSARIFWITRELPVPQQWSDRRRRDARDRSLRLRGRAL
jgi:hypothetical protein